MNTHVTRQLLYCAHTHHHHHARFLVIMVPRAKKHHDGGGGGGFGDAYPQSVHKNGRRDHLVFGHFVVQFLEGVLVEEDHHVGFLLDLALAPLLLLALARRHGGFRLLLLRLLLNDRLYTLASPSDTYMHVRQRQSERETHTHTHVYIQTE